MSYNYSFYLYFAVTVTQVLIKTSWHGMSFKCTYEHWRTSRFCLSWKRMTILNYIHTQLLSACSSSGWSLLGIAAWFLIIAMFLLCDVYTNALYKICTDSYICCTRIILRNVCIKHLSACVLARANSNLSTGCNNVRKTRFGLILTSRWSLMVLQHASIL
jgi:hypothetical protein